MILQPDTSILASDPSDILSLAHHYRSRYKEADPFPHVVIDNFFDNDFLTQVAASFTDLSSSSETTLFSTSTENKLASSRGDSQHSGEIRTLLRYLNSSSFIEFLQILSSIREPLIPDPHFNGAGLHEIKRDGYLKIHADFCKHPETNLDRRINLLIYLNNDWDDSYGGHLELWDKNLSLEPKRILPVFNRMIIFNTTDFTFHGHPEPLTCPADRSRKSLALYYYSNGRPSEELRSTNISQNTLFRERVGLDNFHGSLSSKAKMLLRGLTPPLLAKLLGLIRHSIKS